MVLTATAGVAMAVGLLCIVAGDAFGEAVEQVYRWGDAAETGWDVLMTRLRSKRSLIVPVSGPRLLAGSSGFGPAWRVDGGKIVSLTA
jgi:hypothetical protein